MSESVSPFPDDVALCHEIIRQQADTIQESQRRIEQLELEVARLPRRQCGPGRERVDPDQLRLCADDDLEGDPRVIAEEPRESEVTPPRRPWRRRGRKRLPADLPRQRVEYQLSPE